MRKLTSAGAAAFAASSLLFGASPTTAAPVEGTVQVERSGLRAAEAAFRRAKRDVIASYALATSAAQARLRMALATSETAEDRTAAWDRYHEDTAPMRVAAEIGLQQAKDDFVAELRAITGHELPAD